MLAMMLLSVTVLVAAPSQGLAKSSMDDAEIVRPTLSDKDTYISLLKEGLAIEAPNLAGIYEESPKDARFLADIRKRMVVTGAVGRTKTTRGQIRAVFLETGRKNSVVCELKKPAASAQVAAGSIITIYGLLEGGDGVREVPATLSQCSVVWSVPNVKAAAATALWCSALLEISEEGKKVAVRRGGELLTEAGLERPPLPCNMAFMEIMLQCLNGRTRTECRTEWTSKVMYYFKAPNLR